MRACLLFLSALLALPSLAFAHGKVRTEDFASDRNWRVYTEVPQSATRQGPNFLGKAQRVCLNAAAPSPCPADATLYGYVRHRLDGQPLGDSRRAVDLGVRRDRHDVPGRSRPVRLRARCLHSAAGRRRRRLALGVGGRPRRRLRERRADRDGRQHRRPGRLEHGAERPDPVRHRRGLDRRPEHGRGSRPERSPIVRPMPDRVLVRAEPGRGGVRRLRQVRAAEEAVGPALRVNLQGVGASPTVVATIRGGVGCAFFRSCSSLCCSPCRPAPPRPRRSTTRSSTRPTSARSRRRPSRERRSPPARRPASPITPRNAGGKSVWFRWTAPGDDSVPHLALATFASFDTLLAVYTGASVDNLIEVASNDDGASGGSTVSFAIDARRDLPDRRGRLRRQVGLLLPRPRPRRPSTTTSRRRSR